MIAMLLAFSLAPLFAPTRTASARALAFGPPLVCHEIAIGNARSLPWQSGMQSSASYDRAHLVADVAELLKTEKSLLVRMETLRRAALYAREDRALAWELVGRRACWVLEESSLAAQDAGDTHEAAAWFDLGVLVACFDQLDVDLDFRAGVAEGIDGYAYLRKALDAARAEGRADSGVIEFAAALVTHPGMARGESERERRRELHDAHMERAQQGCTGDPLLAQNIASFRARFAERR